MPRMKKEQKQEWAFFIGANGRRQYNLQCRTCAQGCKQSFRADIVHCPKYTSKRSVSKDVNAANTPSVI